MHTLKFSLKPLMSIKNKKLKTGDHPRLFFFIKKGAIPKVAPLMYKIFRLLF